MHSSNRPYEARLNPDYFEHPLTSLSFSRWPEQVLRRDELVAELTPGILPTDEADPVSVVDVRVNRIMFAEFVQAVQVDVDKRVEAQLLSRDAPSTKEYPDLDVGAVKMVERHNTRVALQYLNMIAPLPDGFDQLESRAA